MSKNLIPEIAKMLGVELGEEFKIDNNSVRFWFDLDGLHSEEFEIAGLTLYRLACGKAEIVKLPWKPEHGRKYWSFIRYYYDDEEKLAVTSSYIWTGDVMGRALLKAGWVFRTKGEAEAALPAVAKELGVEYEL